MLQNSVTVSIWNAFYFSIRQALSFNSVFLFSAFCWELFLSQMQLIQHCHTTVWPAGVAIRGANRQCPVCHRVKELLTIIDFSFVYLSESMFCFASLDRDRPCISISFHCSSPSHIFFNLFPLHLPSMEAHPLLPLLSLSPLPVESLCNP